MGKFIVIVDESKICDGLGPGFPVPVEIVPFCHEHTMREIAKLPALVGCKPVLRLGDVSNNKPDGDKPAITDNGNYIVDLEFAEPIKDPVAAGEQLKKTVGVVDHGLFTGMTTAVIIAGSDGISSRSHEVFLSYGRRDRATRAAPLVRHLGWRRRARLACTV